MQTRLPTISGWLSSWYVPRPRSSRSWARSPRRELLEERALERDEQGAGRRDARHAGRRVVADWDDGVVAHSEADPLTSSVRRAEVAYCRFCSSLLVREVDQLHPRWLHASSLQVPCPRRAQPVLH